MTLRPRSRPVALAWGSRSPQLLVLAGWVLLAVACGGSGVGDPPEPTATTLGLPSVAAGPVGTIALPGVAGGGESAGGSSGSWSDLCDAAPSVHSYLVEIGLLNEADLADLPVPYDFELEGYWTVGPLGPEGAFGVGEELTGAWLCDLDVTPSVRAALEALSDEEGTVIPIEAIIEIITGEPSTTGDSVPGGDAPAELDVLSPAELLKQTRDALNAAGRAAQLGDNESSEELMDLARDLTEAYGETVINTATDPKDVMEVRAMAQLLDLEDLDEMGRAKIEELVEAELADAAELFTPCTTDANVVRIYFRALARAKIIDHAAGDGRAGAWIDVQDRRAAGEDVPECEGAIFIHSTDLEGWDGTLDVHLETCGFARWSGNVTASGTLDADGGTMTLAGTIPLEVFFKSRDYGEGDVASGNFTGAVEVTLTTPDATGEGSTALDGGALFTYLGGGEYELALFFDKGTFDFAIHAAGMTIQQSRSIDWGQKTFTGPVEPFDGLCGPPL